ncbi:hypothetical protein C8R43DRAFT_1239394 [Mycena crocata]|nr:hypothetical protein C8R43DRAFT_1239394 [Mycena crocata]
MASAELDIVPGLRALDIYTPSPDEDYSWEDSLSDLSEPSECDNSDHEEGEISDDGEINPQERKKQIRNAKAHQRFRASRQRKALKAKAEKEKAEELMNARQQLKQMLAAVYNQKVDQIHIHTVKRDMAALKRLLDREEEKSSPLSRSDIDELIPGFRWIHEPGVHLGFLSEEGKDTITVVFAVKFHAWGEMEVATQVDVQETLQTIMDWSEIVYPIKSNAATKFTSPTAHGIRGKRGPPLAKPRGKMFGIGWHLSQEEGSSLVNYAPKNKRRDTMTKYIELHSKLPRVAALVLLTEKVYFHLQTHLMHTDQDLEPVASGKWWVAKKGKKKAKKGTTEAKWSFAEDGDHNKISGGEFIWGAFGIGVDFERARGLVDIFWRGQLDFHGTLESTDTEGYTRWGTSIQITKKGVNAMHKVWKVEELAASSHNIHRLAPKSKARITTAQDRVQKAEAEMANPGPKKSNKRKARA